MSSIEDKFQKAADEGTIPGVVLMATDAKGNFQYQKAFGPKGPTEAMDLSATFFLASCTKLMTSIAALQSVERRQIGLDDDVAPILTELKELQILTGFEEGTETPILMPAYEKITLRKLLSHTSGFGYDAENPSLSRWRKLRGQTSGIKGIPMIDRINIPLLFEPGSSWQYGMGLDWAGLLVERLNHTSLEDYMQEHIWDIVGAADITFHLESKPSVKQRLVKMSRRCGTGNPISTQTGQGERSVAWTDEILYDDQTDDEYGGSGTFGSAVGFMNIMRSILANDGRLLKPQTLEWMFEPQLGEESERALVTFLGPSLQNDSFSSVSTTTKFNHGLGGLLILDDLDTGLKKGTLSWSGFPNLVWTIDRETGLALLYATNIVPFGDPQSAKHQQLFEREMYDRFSMVTG